MKSENEPIDVSTVQVPDGPGIGASVVVDAVVAGASLVVAGAVVAGASLVVAGASLVVTQHEPPDGGDQDDDDPDRPQ